MLLDDQIFIVSSTFASIFFWFNGSKTVQIKNSIFWAKVQIRTSHLITFTKLLFNGTLNIPNRFFVKKICGKQAKSLLGKWIWLNELSIHGSISSVVHLYYWRREKIVYANIIQIPTFFICFQYFAIQLVISKKKGENLQ